MKKDLKLLFDNLKNNRNKKKIIRNVTISLSCIVALITLYILMSPAITLKTVGSYKMYLNDLYLNDNYSWKNEYKTSIGVNITYTDTLGNYFDGRNITINLDNNYDNKSFTFFNTSNNDVINILKENEIETILTDEGKYTFEYAEVYINNSWHKLSVEDDSISKIWCHNYLSEIEPIDNNYGWRGTYSSENIEYIINEDVKYNLVYSYLENEVEENIKDSNLLEEETSSEVKTESSSLPKKKTMMKSPRIALSTDNSVESLGKRSGINFGLYNYYGDNTGEGDNINNNGLYGYFSFRDSSLTDPYNINAELDADGFVTNRIKINPVLDSSFNPVFNCQGKCSGVNNTSLGYLFGETTNAKGSTTVGVQSYAPNNTPLQVENVGGVDYYYYDSNRNAVDYDTVNNNFIVRNYKERGYIITTYEKETNRYEFLPFNYLQNASSPSGNYNYESANDKTEIDHWYGMTMEFEFYMPKNGLLNNEHMIFSFTGDDDVWVFIDNVLVLDLGGTHGSVDGNINFHTGEVTSYLNWNGVEGTVENGTRTNTSIKQMFQSAGRTFESNGAGTTFKDYTKHTLKFFYLERGAAVANCKIRFNIPVLPSGSLSVRKEFEGVEKYNDDYEFVLYDVTNSSPVPSGTKYKIGETEYTINNNEGKFTLKNGEVAVFLSKNDQTDPNNEHLRSHTYYVRESNAGMNASIYSCSLNATTCPTVSKTQEFTMNPESKYQAIFTNKTKTFNLKLSKEAINSDPNDLFDFQITMKDEFDNVVDISKLGLSFPNGYTINQNNKGLITFKIKDDESITISNIPINTVIKIQELDHDGYHTSMKSIVSGSEVPLIEGDTYIINKISDHREIKIYNTPGVVLPETGGIGTIIFTIIGLTLIVGSICGYVYFYRLKEGDR